jgi:glycosyltransferase involved in cell wall biosynthesis
MFDKKISLVIAARNDNYMGNSNWRLELTLNFIADQLRTIQRLQQTEIIVVDWGSTQPLHEVITLTDTAKQIVRYIEVPIDIHEKFCSGSSFPTPIALNVGIRRAAGDFIALTSSDVLWTGDVLKSFLQVDADDIHSTDDLNRSLIFIPRKNIPWSFVSQSPGITEIIRYLMTDGKDLEVEPLLPFYLGCAGALVMHRHLWIECQGNDEKLVFWGFNDIDLNLRIRLKYTCLDYNQTNKMYVYHLEHYQSRADTQSAPKKLNPHVFNPLTVNDENWGLAQYSFAEWPLQPESTTIISSPKKKNSPTAYFRIKHLGNILSFLFSGGMIKHLSCSFSILQDYFTDLLFSRNK